MRRDAQAAARWAALIHQRRDPLIGGGFTA
jgi:hypothetical protein